jgi:hypothetical protein
MRFSFFIVIALLSVMDSLLLAKPNLLGKVGLLIFKYNYLRTFPRAMLTVSIVVGTAMVFGELIIYLEKRKGLSKTIGGILLFFLVVACSGLLAKLFMDFSKGVYSHTGIYFKYGVFLLPLILIVIFGSAFVRLVKKNR